MATFNTNLTAVGGLQQLALGNTIRNQHTVAQVIIDEGVLGPIDAIYASPRVVSQTPKAGTVLARGSTVNLVLANGRTLPTKVITGSYAKWQAEPLGKLYDDYLKDDPTLTTLVGKYADDSKLSDAERTQVIRTLESRNVPVGSGAGNDFDSVMVALGAAQAFNGVVG